MGLQVMSEKPLSFGASSSTKNKARGLDPEMSSTKKGNDWFFGMKAHIGVDAESGVIHSLDDQGA